MKFEVYCDESMSDVLTSSKQTSNFLLIGSLWLCADLRKDIKNQINELRKKHNAFGEIKWHKISLSKLGFYEDLVDLFTSYDLDLRFRCICIDKRQINSQLINNDNELGFYKFYYQLLHHWISEYNEYSIFCDTKTNRDPRRLMVLKNCLNNANIYSEILNVQFLPSDESAIIQLTDLLLGAVNARINNFTLGHSKEIIVAKLEKNLVVPRISSTYRNEQKFNIFKINLSGGWQ